MRRIVWLLLIVSGAVGIALLMRVNHGNIAVLWPPYRIDLSINLAVLILIAIFLLLHLLFGILSNALNLPGRVREYRDRRRRDRALTGLRDSLLAYFEGRFGRAERLARSALSDHSVAGSAALIGARAAQRMREIERRDGWLESARLTGNVESAYRATMAEVALEEDRPADALAEVGHLRVRGVRPVHALRLALRSHEQLGDWPQALQVLRQLERRDAIDAERARAVRTRAVRAQFARLADDADGTVRLWNELPAAERDNPDVALAGARALLRAGRHETAGRIVERALDERYDAELVALWPELTGLPVHGRLKRAEGWLQKWGEEPALLVALGRICAAEELWGKAEEFLLRAERRDPDAQTRTLLAQLCERLDRPADAARWYREAALAAFGDEMVRLAPERLPALTDYTDGESDDDSPRALPIPGP